MKGKVTNMYITIDLNDVVRDLQAEAIEQIKDNKELKAELDKVKKGNIDTIMDVGLDNERLQAENDKLKYDLKYSYKDNEELKAENKRLNRVNAELSDKLQAVNDDYNNDTKVHNEYADGLLAEIKELKRELKHKAIKIHQDRIPKEYKAEADEYFAHNPKSKGVRFHMIGYDEYGSDNDLMGTFSGELYADDCIIEIDNP